MQSALKIIDENGNLITTLKSVQVSDIDIMLQKQKNKQGQEGTNNFNMTFAEN